MDVGATLTKTLGATYRVERELPRGGMSRVFVAEELALGRQVVVKVLPPDLAAGVSAERFSREIQLAAKLQQANIVPLLSFGVVGGLPYYTMPYVAGESLRARIAANGALPVSQALGILRDVARALTYAHEQGIVHRDIKPENVLLSGDAAVVTDFGIAKAINVSITAAGVENLTTTGTVVGTPAYIAPEQAAGDPAIDHRADFYSFGCVAYELFTGRPPFFGKNPQALLAAHLSEIPTPVEKVTPEIPSHVAELVARCLEKSPAKRPQTGREILQVLDTVHSPVRTAPASSGAGKRTAILAGLSLLVMAGLGYAFWKQRSASPSAATPHTKAVAVLPFTNIGGDSADAYFADGMADELIAALGKVPGLSVASRRSAFALKQRNDLDVPSIGRLLHVDAVLESTVRRAGNRMRVTSQLTSTSDGLTLWSDSYEREMKDVFAVQDDITKSIVGALSLKLGNGQRQITSNLAAYDDYLRGAYALEQRGPGVAQSVELFNSAIKKDSSFARAYGKLSEALELMPYFAGVSAVSVEKRATDAANKALALDPMDAEAHIGLALATGHAFDWTESDRQFRLAIAADTNSAIAHTQYGRQLLQTARVPEAIAELRKGVVLDPLSGTQVAWLANAIGMNGDSASALKDVLTAIARFPQLDLVKQVAAFELVKWKRYAEAHKLAEQMPMSLGFRGQAGYVLGKTGDRAAALKLVKDLRAMPDTSWLVHTALAYTFIGLGDSTQALSELERALKRREITPKWLPFGNVVFDPIRASPRFAAVVHGFGLDEKLFIPPNRGRP